MKVSISGKSKSRNFDMDILNKLDYALIPTNLIISTGRTIHLITFYIISIVFRFVAKIVMKNGAKIESCAMR